MSNRRTLQSFLDEGPIEEAALRDWDADHEAARLEAKSEKRQDLELSGQMKALGMGAAPAVRLPVVCTCGRLLAYAEGRGGQGFTVLTNRKGNHERSAADPATKPQDRGRTGRDALASVLDDLGHANSRYELVCRNRAAHKKPFRAQLRSNTIARAYARARRLGIDTLRIGEDL